MIFPITRLIPIPSTAETTLSTKQASGKYFESKDGLNWQNPQIGWFGAEHYIKQPPAPKHLKRYGRFERPQVLMKNGKPAYLFTASQGGKAETSSGFVFKIKPE